VVASDGPAPSLDLVGGNGQPDDLVSVRMQALAEASQAFAQAGQQLDVVLEHVVRRVAELVGGACAIRLLAEDGQHLILAALYHPNQELVAAARALLDATPQRVDEGLAAYVLGGGQALLLPAVDLEAIRASIRPEYHGHLDRWPLSSMLTVPLRTNAGVFGMLSMTRYAGEPPYTPADQAFLTSLADRAALAIANARLFASVEQARAEAERAAEATLSLQRLTAALSEALTPDETLAIVAAHVQETFGAASGAIGLVTADRTALELVQIVGYKPGDLAPWQRMSLDTPQPGSDVVRDGAAQFWESPAALLAHYPQLGAAVIKSKAWAIVPLRGEGHTLGMLSLGFPSSRTFDADTRAHLETLARQCANAIQRTRRYAAAEQAAARTARLQQITAALGAAVTPEAVADIFVRESMVAIGADAASIFAFDAEAHEFHLLGYRNYPEEFSPQHQRQPADQPGPLRDAVETRSIVLAESAEELVRRWPQIAATQQRTGDQATAMVPLLLDATVLGAFYLAFRRPHRFSQEEQGLLLALGQQCAQALERARLHVAERTARLAAERTAARTARLYAVTSALAEALTLGEVARVIVEQGMAALGASAGSVRQLSPDGSALTALQIVGYPPEIEDQWRTIPLDAPVPMAEAARRAQPILIESVDAIERDWPQFIEAMQALHYQATALLPLLVAGRPIGTMSFGFATPRSFDADDREFLDALARQCAIALERARLYAATEVQAARLGTLAEASRLFAAASLDLQAVLDAVARRVAAALGDLGVVGLLSDDGQQLRLAAIAHHDPEALAVMTQLLGDFPLRVDEGISGYALRTGQGQLLPQIQPEQLRAQIKPEHWPYLDRFGIHSLMVAPLRVGGEVVGTLGALRDTPGRPYTADDLTMLQELADRAGLAIANARLYQRARDAIQIRDQFLSIAAHELKTPLTSLYGQAQLIQRRLSREQQTDERLARSIDLIVRQAGRLDAMVTTLLDVGRIERGQFVLDRQHLDLAVLVARVVDEVRPLLDQHTLVYEPGVAAVTIDGDPIRLEQALQNLLSNAVKYSPGGGTITVRLRATAQAAEVSVTDQGIGIPSAAIAQLFQQFYRAENVVGQHISGMGVGLYVVHEIVRRHDGSVHVESSEGVGSTFTIRLPSLAACSAGPEGA
jgi:GAF domain-containing protein/anti-sigma regulatory factor (Ser/Thr protein kinase)